MTSFTVTGGRPLYGTLRVQGAKNSALPILAAAVLTRDVSEIRNCPRLADTRAAADILRELGCRVWREGGAMYVDSSAPIRCSIAPELMGRMRSSVIFLGAILARCGEAVLSAPGGCAIGARPIDMHLEALRSLGAEITEGEDRICCRASRIRGARIRLPFPSVGATENALLAAVLGEGETLLLGAAREPEIRDLQDYLNAAGACVSGAGTDVIRIRGVKRLHGAAHRVIPDRIAAATWLCACAAAGGEIRLRDVCHRHCAPVLDALRRMGCRAETREGEVLLRAPVRPGSPGTVVTGPYPGFPTDAQPLLMAAVLGAEGVTAFRENIFEDRYRHVPELRRLGAEIRTEGRTALVTGTEELRGAVMRAYDLRGCAALVIGALSASGRSRILGGEYLDRGYEAPEECLRRLGAGIERTEDTHE